MALDISVIVPTYNRADLIVETLESILQQSYKAAEVIVVDDGSKDDTAKVVRKFGSAVQYIRIDNSGECKARNVGVAASKCSWIAFCDSDDLWRPNKLMLQAGLLEKVPGVEYSFTNFQTVVDGRWSAPTKFDTSPAGYWNIPRRDIAGNVFVVDVAMNDRLLVHQPIFPSTVLIKRSFFEAVGRWREALGRTPSVDLEFHFRCVSSKGIGVVSESVVGIRKHESNFSGDTLRTTLGEIQILRYLLANNPVAKDHATSIKREIRIRSIAAAEAAFAAGKLSEVAPILSLVPYSQRNWRLQVKSLIAATPGGFGSWLQRRAVAARRSPP
jgi:glycosyltransferase involved in cell wall biosynthesis